MRKLSLFLSIAAITLVGCNQAFYSGYSDELYYTPRSQENIASQSVRQQQNDEPMTQEQLKQGSEYDYSGIYESEDLLQSSSLMSMSESNVNISFSLMGPGFYASFNNMYYNDWYYPYYGPYARYRWTDYWYWDWWFTPYYSWYYNPWYYNPWHWSHYPGPGWGWHENHHHHRQYISHRPGSSSNRPNTGVIKAPSGTGRENISAPSAGQNDRPSTRPTSPGRETQTTQRPDRSDVNISTGRNPGSTTRPNTTVDNNKIQIPGRDSRPSQNVNSGSDRVNTNVTTNPGRGNSNTTINDRTTTRPNNDRVIRSNENMNYNNNRNSYNNSNVTSPGRNSNSNMTNPGRNSNNTISTPSSGGGRNSGTISPSGGGRSGGSSSGSGRVR